MRCFPYQFCRSRCQSLKQRNPLLCKSIILININITKPEKRVKAFGVQNLPTSDRRHDFSERSDEPFAYTLFLCISVFFSIKFKTPWKYWKIQYFQGVKMAIGNKGNAWYNFEIFIYTIFWLSILHPWKGKAVKNGFYAEIFKSLNSWIQPRFKFNDVRSFSLLLFVAKDTMVFQTFSSQSL